MKKLIAATATPLASIFGSGFLVSVPILNGAVGKCSVFAMATVCAPAYCVGHAIRFNIKNAESLLENHEAGKTTEQLERSSYLALASRAFAFYYMLQCIISITVSKSGIQKLFFGVIAAVLAFITIFAVPAG